MTGGDLLGADDIALLAPEEIIERVRVAGVIGMGGGGYPAADKLQAAGVASTVIGNGMETEPLVRTDQHLLAEEPQAVANGLLLVGRAVAATRLVLALPPESAALAASLSELPAWQADGLEVRIVEAAFPAGEERRLVRSVCGIEVPRHRRPTDCGVVVFNVATLAAIAHAVAGAPPTHRYVSVHGETRRVRFGTPVAELLDGIDGKEVGVRIGGYSGRPARANEIVDATTIAVEAAPGPELPCIRCGWCIAPCPERLDPERMLDHLRRGLVDTDADRCIECGACNAACPSTIDLVNVFRDGKAKLERQRREEAAAAKAKARFEAKNARLAMRAQAATSRRAERLAKPRKWD